jgi:hypothetical protein
MDTYIYSRAAKAERELAAKEAAQEQRAFEAQRKESAAIDAMLPPQLPPEHDPSLVPEQRQAHRMLKWLAGYDDTPQHPFAAYRRESPAFEFVLRHGAGGDVLLTGTLDQHWLAIANANVMSRTEIFIRSPVPAIVAAVTLPRRDDYERLPPDARPSIRYFEAPARQGWVWLLNRAPSKEERERVAAALAGVFEGATVANEEPPLLRLSGTFTRGTVPMLLSAQGNAGCGESCGPPVDPAELARQLEAFADRLAGVIR